MCEIFHSRYPVCDTEEVLEGRDLLGEQVMGKALHQATASRPNAFACLVPWV